MPKINKDQAGFSTVIVAVTLLVVLAIAGTGFMVFKKSSDNRTATAPDGNTNPGGQTIEQSAQPQKPAMKQYANSQYGFSFEYPQEWSVREVELSTLSEENLEFYLQIVADEKTEPEAVGLAVRSISFHAQVSNMSGFIDAHDRTDKKYHTTSTFKGKQSAKFTIPQTVKDNRIIYYFEVGNKTYSVQTLNEETNNARDPDYMAKFDTLIESLKLP